ncbi:MAG: TetR/AcrR family transcriptional regulator [Polyangiales bacterium]
MERAKKECILTEAGKAFTRFGFKKTSVDEIAKKAGVAKGTVYLAAESKEDLFYQVLHRELRAWIAECAQMIDPRKPADQLIGELMETALGYLEERPLVRELLFGEAAAMLPAWAERLEELRDIARASLVEVLKLGVSQGVFRKDLDLELTAAVLHDMNIAGHIFSHRQKESAELKRRRHRVGLQIVLDGLRAR